MSTDTTNIITTTDTKARSIEGVVHVDDEGRELYIRVSHYAPRRSYMISVGRRIVRDHIVRERFSVGDNPPFRTELIPTDRYSAKTLEKHYHDTINSLASERLPELIEWARAARA